MGAGKGWRGGKNKDSGVWGGGGGEGGAVKRLFFCVIAGC